MGSGHATQFGATVRARRQQLNLTLDAVRSAGGPTGPTVIRAEAGELLDPRPSTLAKFDAALRWSPGSAAALYWSKATPREPRTTLRPGVASVPLTTEFMLELLATDRTLHDHLAAQVNPDPQLVAVADRLNKQVSTVVGMFVTDLLERNVSAEGSDTTHPILEYALGEILGVPVAEGNDAVEERLYRRWLMGKAEGLAPDVLARFHARLAKRR